MKDQRIYLIKTVISELTPKMSISGIIWLIFSTKIHKLNCSYQFYSPNGHLLSSILINALSFFSKFGTLLKKSRFPHIFIVYNSAELVEVVIFDLEIGNFS